MDGKQMIGITILLISNSFVITWRTGIYLVSSGLYTLLAYIFFSLFDFQNAVS